MSSAASRPSEPAPRTFFVTHIGPVSVNERGTVQFAANVQTPVGLEVRAGDEAQVICHADTIFEIADGVREALTASPSPEERPAPATPLRDERLNELMVWARRARKDGNQTMHLEAREMWSILDRLTAAEQRADEAERRLAEIREAWAAPSTDSTTVPVRAECLVRLEAALAASPESVR